MLSDAQPAHEFPSALRRIRAEQGLTQAELAEKAELSTEAYGRLERGGPLPRAETLVRLAMALEVTTDALLGLAEPEGRPGSVRDGETKELRRVVRRLRSASPQTLQLLNQLLGSIDRDAARRTAAKTGKKRAGKKKKTRKRTTAKSG